MITLLLALCCGLANAARGSGYKLIPFTFRGKRTSLTKPILLVCVALATYTITQSIWLAVIFPLSLGLSWSVEGGTGGYMPWVIKRLSFLGLGNNTWRFFEFISVFLLILLASISYELFSLLYSL